MTQRLRINKPLNETASQIEDEYLILKQTQNYMHYKLGAKIEEFRSSPAFHYLIPGLEWALREINEDVRMIGQTAQHLGEYKVEEESLVTNKD